MTDRLTIVRAASRATKRGFHAMPQIRSIRTVSALLGTASLVVVLSLAAAPALAADAPWSSPVEVTDAYGDANATVVAPDGTITLVSESAVGIAAATSTDAGLTWSSVLVGSGGDYAFRPAIGVTSSGLLAASWVESLSDVRTIWVAISADKGATWSTPEALPTVSSEMDDPVVASASASGFTIVWNEGFAKYSTVSTDGGVTWSPAQVITQFFNSYGSASLAPVGAGEIVVVFQEFDGDTAQYSIQSERSTDGGATWGPKVMVGSDWSGSLGNGIYSYGVSPAAGTVVAVWSRGTDTGEALFATTSTDGGASWAPQFGVSVEDGSLRYFTVRAVSPTTVGVLWHYETAAGSTLSYSTVTVGEGAATPPVTVATSPSYGFDRLPSFSTLGDVRVASWFDYSDSDETAGFRTSVSCDAGATWSTPAVLAIGNNVAESDAQTTVSGETFAALWRQDATGPTGESLYASTVTDPTCATVSPVRPALAATGAPITTTALIAFVIVALGTGLLVVRRRSAA